MSLWTAWRGLASAALAGFLTGAANPGASRQPAADPFAFFAPEVTVSKSDRRRLDRGDAVARALEANDGQLAVFVVTRLKAPPDALVAWTHAIAEFKRSKYVLAIGRLSDPPVLDDFNSLTLDERDLEKIRECVPGDCGLKLTANEIDALRRVADSAGANWRHAVQARFRQVVLARVNAYRAGGLQALAPIADESKPEHLEEAFQAIVARSPYLEKLPNLAAWLRDYPNASARSIESFFYWSKESYGTGKPVISVTHVGIVRPRADHRLPAVAVAGKQILATHYVEGALGLTMVLSDEKGVSYLVYLNRSRLDLLEGFFGGFVRGFVERRLERDAPRIVSGLRERLESGKLEK